MYVTYVYTKIFVMARGCVVVVVVVVVVVIIIIIIITIIIISRCSTY
jgi:hypothetical protein